MQDSLENCMQNILSNYRENKKPAYISGLNHKCRDYYVSAFFVRLRTYCELKPVLIEDDIYPPFSGQSHKLPHLHERQQPQSALYFLF